MATTYHAEHVGSLLRPPYLRAGRRAAGRKLELVASVARQVWG
jgi:hypothetical protein